MTGSRLDDLKYCLNSGHRKYPQDDLTRRYMGWSLYADIFLLSTQSGTEDEQGWFSRHLPGYLSGSLP